MRQHIFLGQLLLDRRQTRALRRNSAGSMGTAATMTKVALLMLMFATRTHCKDAAVVIGLVISTAAVTYVHGNLASAALALVWRRPSTLNSARIFNAMLAATVANRSSVGALPRFALLHYAARPRCMLAKGMQK